MKIRDIISTLICFIILIILIIVLFMVKNNLNNKNTKTPTESNKENITIKYDSNGGNYLKDSEIKKGNSLVLPTPVKEGYKFIGWYVDGKLVDENTKFDNNKILIAKWILIGSPYEKQSNKKTTTSNTTTETNTTTTTKTKLTVSFDTKGGSYIAPITSTCNNVALELPEDPVKENAEFKGWVDKNNNPVGNGTILPCEDITLYATWGMLTRKIEVPVGPTVILHFDSTGGSEVPSRIVACTHQPMTFPVPTKEGYIFGGWFDIEGREFRDGAIVSCGVANLYARWYIAE